MGKSSEMSELGNSGDPVLLQKLRIKKNYLSKTKKGVVLQIILGKPIALGHPIVSQQPSTKSKEDGEKKIFQKSHTVLNIRKIEETVFLIETETSIYKAKVYPKQNL